MIDEYFLDDDDSNNTVAHGDELSYLFDPHDIEGKALLSEKEENEEDNKVREIFTQMITDFARFGKLKLGDQDVKPFSISDNNFVQITPNPKIASGFRYCEMGLWLGLAQRLQSNTCKLLKVLDIKNLPTNLGGGTQKVGETLGLGGLMGGRKPTQGTGGSKLLSNIGIGR